MASFIVNNKAGIIREEKSVLDLFRMRIEEAIRDGYRLGFYVAVGFFFFDGFREIYPLVKKLYDEGLLDEIRVIMGPETRRETAEILSMLYRDALSLDDEIYQFIHRLYKEGKFSIKVYYDRRFHIKLYIFFEDGHISEVWAGSANFTSGGLRHNIELVVPTGASKDERMLYKHFFDVLWSKASEDVAGLHIIDNILRDVSPKKYVYLPPKQFIATLINLWNKRGLIGDRLMEKVYADKDYRLGKFQKISLLTVLNIMEKYGGAILANSVGLGKTDVACHIVKKYADMGLRSLIIVPPAVKEHWKRTLDKVGAKENSYTLISMWKLSQKDFDISKYSGYGLIIVDEAHNFRTTKPKSMRRQNLEELTKENKDAHVLLVTATPINLSPRDFISLINLFLRGTYLTRVRDEGILNNIHRINNALKLGIEGLEPRIIRLLIDLMQTFSIRIDWIDIARFFKEDLLMIAKKDAVEEPEVHMVEYEYDKEIRKRIFDKIVPFLRKLNYEYTKLWEEQYADEKEQENLIVWYKWRLYKRLESSIEAFKYSIEMMKKRNEYLLENLPKIDREEEVEETNLFERDRLENIFSTYKSLRKIKKETVLKRIEEDIKTINEMLQEINKIEDIHSRDVKIQKLLEIIESEKKPMLIFTESAVTADYIGSFLKNKGLRFRVVHGKHRVKKDTIERMFNEGKFDILVATDMMSEGVNLPRADVVVNFDLPYNPVRLIQRDGRAIRITNPKKVTIYNFKPSKRIDKELELFKRLTDRVEDIVRIVGLDFMIWAIDREGLDKFTEERREKVYELIEKYKEVLASQNPEELKKMMPPSLPHEYKILKEFINYYDVSDEDILNATPPNNKIIYTAFRTGENGYFILYKYRGNIYALGNFIFSDNPMRIEITKNDEMKIRSLVDEDLGEKEMEKWRGILWGRDKISREIKKIVDKHPELRMLFINLNINTDKLTKEEKKELLKYVKKYDNALSLEREDIINEIRERFSTFKHQDHKDGWRILAVIKYV